MWARRHHAIAIGADGQTIRCRSKVGSHPVGQTGNLRAALDLRLSDRSISRLSNRPPSLQRCHLTPCGLR